jgi:hypothetical protein
MRVHAAAGATGHVGEFGFGERVELFPNDAWYIKVNTFYHTKFFADLFKYVIHEVPHVTPEGFARNPVAWCSFTELVKPLTDCFVCLLFGHLCRAPSTSSKVSAETLRD